MGIPEKVEGQQEEKNATEVLSELKTSLEEEVMKSFGIVEDKRSFSKYGSAYDSIFSEEELTDMKSTLSKTLGDLDLYVPENTERLRTDISFGSVGAHWKGKKAKQYVDSSTEPVSFLKIGTQWGTNYVYVHVYEYDIYEGYTMINIGLNNDSRFIFTKFEGEEKDSFIPFCLLLNSIVVKRINPKGE